MNADGSSKTTKVVQQAERPTSITTGVSAAALAKDAKKLVPEFSVLYGAELSSRLQEAFGSLFRWFDLVKESKHVVHFRIQRISRLQPMDRRVERPRNISQL